ncbi:MAG: NADH-quinone oxidoreductase subunit M [candidate division NC10 bacterium]|jgi:NADH-quinone oxidoreductase subunit M
MSGVTLPLLTIVTFLPLAGAILLLFIRRDKEGLIRRVSLVVTGVTLLISLALPLSFDFGSAEFQFVERVSWIPTIGVSYIMGIDGISLWLVCLTALISPIAVLCSWEAITERVKEYHFFLLLMHTGMMGVFLALDFFLFYVFWEVVLVPMYFLIGIWGHPARRLYAAIKFFLYTLFGSVVMLLGILAVYFYAGAQTGTHTFDILELMKVSYPWSPSLLSFQNLVWLAFFLSFAIKVPMFPFHTWLPDAHTEAPTAGSLILAAVLLKMGTYGFVRFSLPMFPEATLYFVPFMVTLSIFAIIYGAMVCLVQQDMKRLIAFSSVSHMGFVMLGMFALNMQGLQGSILQMVNHGLSTGALFLIVGLIYDRIHSRMIADMGGLSTVMPIYGTLFAITMFSSIGLPGLNGFIGEFLILVGAFKVSWVWALFAVSGIVLGAAYMLWLFQRTMFGKVIHERNKGLLDLNLREVMTLIPLVIMFFWIGLYPAPFLKAMEPSVQKVVKRLDQARKVVEAPTPTPVARNWARDRHEE